MTAKYSNCGDLYKPTTMNVDSKLFISHHEGDMPINDAIKLFMNKERKINKNSQIPIFTSDNWDTL